MDLSISEATVARVFRNLKKNDLLTRHNADKNGYWQIIEKGKEVEFKIEITAPNNSACN